MNKIVNAINKGLLVGCGGTNKIAVVKNVSSDKATGSYNAAEVIDIKVTFSEAVNVTGTPQLELETGTTDRQAVYNSGSGTKTLVFRYTVQATDTTGGLHLDYKATTSLTLNGGTIKDGSKAAATLTLPTPGAANSLKANSCIIIVAATQTVAGGADVTIVSSGDTTNNVWLAPTGKTDATTFAGSATMTKATNGIATSISAPATAGTYKLYVIDAANNVSESTISVTVDNTAPTNQNIVLAAAQTKAGGAAVTIVSSGDVTNAIWLAPAGTTTFATGVTMTKATNGTSISILAPANAGTYKLYVIDAAGNISTASTKSVTSTG